MRFLLQADVDRIRAQFPADTDLFFVSAKHGQGLVPLLSRLRHEYDDFVRMQQERIKERQFEFV